MGSLKSSSWQCSPRKNSAQIVGYTPPLVSPDVALRWKKSNSPPYTRGKNPMGGLKNSSWQCPPRKNSAQILGCTPPLLSRDVAVMWKKSNSPPYTRGKNPMGGGLKNSSWQCPPRKNSAQILGCTPSLVSPDVAVRWKKSNSPP